MATRKKTAKKAAKKKPAAKKKTAAKTKKTAKKKKKKTKKASSSSKPAARRKKSPARPLTRAAAALPKSPRIAKLSMTWKFSTGTQAVGLWVDELVWISNSAGDVYALTREGEVMRQLKLPGGSVSTLADEAWKYAGCDDGKVYDLTGRVPRAMYDVGAANIGWLEVYRGALAVSDLGGTLAVFDVDGEQRWRKSIKNAGEGWVLRVDSTGLYHGSEVGLRKLSWSGELVWHNIDVDDVRFGVEHGDTLLVTGGYQKKSETTLYVVDKDSGKTLRSVHLHAGAGFRSNGAEAAAVRVLDDGTVRLYAACGGYIFAFDEQLQQLWDSKLGGADCVCNMQIVDDTLFFVTNNGAACAVDVSEAAIAGALAGQQTTTRVARAPERAAADTQLEVVSEAGAGVVVEVVRQGGKLKVRPVGAGYRSDWFCQFPRDLREEGARFVVDELREAAQGGFYRALGDIKRLQG